MELLIEPGVDLDSGAPATLPAAYLEPRWFAAYTRSRHEKSVAEQLARQGVEFYLPLYERLSRWQHRRVRLQLPLFPGYIFVRIVLKDRLQVLRIPSVVRIVGFNGQPTSLPEGEIEALRESLALNLRAEPHPFLAVGRRVRLKSGPLAGFEGILVRRKGSLRLVLSINLIQRSILVETDSSELEPVA